MGRAVGPADVVAWTGSCAATVLCLYAIWLGPAPRPAVTTTYTHPATTVHAAATAHRPSRPHAPR